MPSGTGRRRSSDGRTSLDGGTSPGRHVVLLAVKYDCRLVKVEEHKVLSGTSTQVSTVWTWKHKKGSIVLRTKNDVPEFPRSIGTDYVIEIKHMQTAMNKDEKVKK